MWFKKKTPSIAKLPYARAMEFVKKGDTLSALTFAREQLRWTPNHIEALKLVDELSGHDVRFLKLNSYEPEFVWMVRQVAAHTMLSIERLHALYVNAKQRCENQLEGDFVECGVAGGGSTLLLSMIIAMHSKVPRKLYSFDTFEGMPPPSDEDKSSGINAIDAGWGANSCSAPITFVQGLLDRYGVQACCELRQGLFENTLPIFVQSNPQLALLHMDGDWYSSTKAIMTNLYDKVRKGGYVQIDDYGYWEGCRRAVHEYFEERSLNDPQMSEIDSTGRGIQI